MERSTAGEEEPISTDGPMQISPELWKMIGVDGKRVCFNVGTMPKATAPRPNSVTTNNASAPRP
mgnify:CR=1 FL=1